MQYHWPGNVRELENMVKRMVVLGNEQAVLEEIARRAGAGRRGGRATALELDALGVDLANGEAIDLKAISQACRSGCREAGDRAGARSRRAGTARRPPSGCRSATRPCSTR